jgi:uncharacterized membrane protein
MTGPGVPGRVWHRSMSPDRVFLVGSLLAGIALAVLFPPLSIADEPLHFYRAAGLARGELVAPRLEGVVGAEIPVSLLRLVAELRVGDALPQEPDRKLSPVEMRAAFEWPLERSDRRFVSVGATGMYPFAAHLFQAVGIGLGYLLSASPPLLVLLGRLANLVGTTVLTWLAIRATPVGRWPLAVVALAPMAVSSRSSLSADAITTAVAFCFLSLVARLAWGGQERRWDGLLLAASAVALCLTKLPYVVLLGALAMVPFERLALRRRWRRWLASLAAVGLALAFTLWSASRVPTTTRPGVDVDRDRQARELVTQPQRFLGAMAADFTVHTDRYAAQAVGLQLGWLDVQLPVLPIVGYGLGFLLLLLAGEARLPVRRWQRGVAALVGLAVAVGISASQYALWTPSGAFAVEGVQGRYFLPAAPLLVWLLLRRRRETLADHDVAPLVFAGWAVVTVVACWCVAQRYYG